MFPFDFHLLDRVRQQPAKGRLTSRKSFFLTHHKCASSWLRCYLERVCELNELDIAATHLSNDLADHNAAISLTCNAQYGFVESRLGNGVHIIRNPFDLLCSAYHSHLRVHRVEGWKELAEQRRLLETVSYETGIMLTIAFLERVDFDQRGAVGPFAGLRGWNYDDPRFQTIRMEDMVADPAGTIGKALQCHFNSGIILPRNTDFRFEMFSGARAPGTVDNNSHYRVGKPGHFKVELPSDAVNYILTHFRPLIERFYPEYVDDRSLVL